MALLPYADENKDTSPETLEALKRPNTLNVVKMIANSEPCFREFGKLGGVLFNKVKLAPKLRELAILKTAKASHSVYEWTQHVPAARHVGVTEEQVAAVENWQNAKCFSELERLVLQLTDEVAVNVKRQAGDRGGSEEASEPGGDRRAYPDDRKLGNGGAAARDPRGRPGTIRRQVQHPGATALGTGAPRLD